MKNLIYGILFLSTTALATTTPAKPADYQKVITKQYPGFVIMKKEDFTPETAKLTSPALTTGNFNTDKFQDFAAHIRTTTKKRYEAGANSYDYYEGQTVSCLGQKGGGYKCTIIGKGQVSIPQESYLKTEGPQKAGCLNDNGDKDFIEVKTDSIGYYIPEKASGLWIYQKDGSYLNCITSD